MNAAEAQHAYDRLSKGVTAFFFALMLVAVVVMAVRAIRGERPTKEMLDACLLGGLIFVSIMPDIIPHSKVPALVGMISLVGVGVWRLARSRRRRQ